MPVSRVWGGGIIFIFRVYLVVVVVMRFILSPFSLSLITSVFTYRLLTFLFGLYLLTNSIVIVFPLHDSFSFACLYTAIAVLFQFFRYFSKIRCFSQKWMLTLAYNALCWMLAVYTCRFVRLVGVGVLL